MLGEVLTASVTPFDTDGAVNVSKFRELAAYLVDNGSDGLVVTGTTGVSRLTSSGSVAWTKVGAGDKIAASGTNVYVKNKATVRKLDVNGRQLWSKAQSGLSGIVVGDMTADASGNVYLTGKYSATTTNRNIFTRKLNGSGTVLFTKTFGTSAYDDARGIATINGSEIYITGSTQGSLAHAYRGGENDAADDQQQRDQHDRLIQRAGDPTLAQHEKRQGDNSQRQRPFPPPGSIDMRVMIAHSGSPKWLNLPPLPVARCLWPVVHVLMHVGCTQPTQQSR